MLLHMACSDVRHHQPGRVVAHAMLGLVCKAMGWLHSPLPVVKCSEVLWAITAAVYPVFLSDAVIIDGWMTASTAVYSSSQAHLFVVAFVMRHAKADACCLHKV